MADLPKYQPTGLNIAQLGNIPRVEFAASAEAIRQSQGIDASLDRISQFAFKEAAEEAKRKGTEYAAENEITPEQVKAALIKDVNPNNLLVKSGTYFGDAARAIQISQLRVSLEIDGRNKLVNIENEIDKNPDIDLEKIKLEINSVTNGYANILSKMDAEEAIRFKQSMAAAGNQTYRIAAKKSIEIGTATRQADYEKAKTNLPSRISGILNEAPPDVIIDRIRGEVSINASSAAKTGSAITVLDDRKYTTEVLNKAIADKVLDPSSNMLVTDAITSIKKGTHPGLSTIVKELKLDTNKIEELILAQADQNKRAGEFFYYEQDKKADAIERRLYSSVDPKVHKQAFEELSKLPINASRIKTARDFIFSDSAIGPQRDDLNQMAKVLGRIASSDITYQEVIAAPGLTRETRSKFIAMIINPQDDIARGITEIKLSAGFQGANLPPDIKDDLARKIVTDARNKAEIELMTFGRSMVEVDGVRRAPTAAEIKSKAKELADGTSIIYKNAMSLSADKTKAGIVLMLPSLVKVDLNKQADVDKAISDAIAAKKLTPASARQLRTELETWRKNKSAANEGAK